MLNRNQKFHKMKIKHQNFIKKLKVNINNNIKSSVIFKLQGLKTKITENKVMNSPKLKRKV